MELRDYWSILAKWWWLFLLCALLGAGAAVAIGLNTTPTYEATTTVMVGASLDIMNPTTGELQTSEKLAQTYAELIKTRPILDATVTALNLPRRPIVSVTLVRNTQLMRIMVEDSDAQRAAATADELANQLIQQSPSAPQRQEQAYREVVTRQLEDLQLEMEALSVAIVQAEGAGNQQEQARLQQDLNNRRENYALLLSYLRSGSTNLIRVIEPAVVPGAPIRPKIPQNALLAGVVGLILAGAAAFLIEYMDDTFKTAREVEQLLDVPILGAVARNTDHGQPALVSAAHPTSPQAESYRVIRTNLRYSLPGEAHGRVYLVTSAGPSEGKSTVITNLATVMAQTGLSTVMVDADLRRPALHRAFGQTDTVGLTSLLVGETHSLDETLRRVSPDPLWLLPSGPVPPNAAELLGSAQMKDVLEQLRQRADVVLVDSPPLLAVTDASILATMVSGTVMVIEAGQTHHDDAVQALRRLEKVRAKILGVVLNGVRARGSGEYKYHYYTEAGMRQSRSQQRQGNMRAPAQGAETPSTQTRTGR